MGAFDPDTTSNNLLICDNFDLGLNDLGWDVQLLEERGLLGIETSCTSSNPHIIRGDSTNLGWSLSGFLIKNFLDIRKIPISEDNSGVALE